MAQSDNYGRVVDISTQDLIAGFTAEVRTAQANISEVINKLQNIASKTSSQREKVGNLTGELRKTLLDPAEVAEMMGYLKKLVEFNEDIKKQKERFKGSRDDSGGKSLEKNLINAAKKSNLERLGGRRVGATAGAEMRIPEQSLVKALEKTIGGKKSPLDIHPNDVKLVAQLIGKSLDSKTLKSLTVLLQGWYDLDVQDKMASKSAMDQLIKAVEKYGPESSQARAATDILVATMKGMQSKFDKFTTKFTAFSSHLSAFANGVSKLDVTRQMGMPTYDILADPLKTIQENFKGSATWMQDIHAALFETTGARGRGSALQESYYATGTEREKMFLQTGAPSEKVQEQMLKNMRRGMRDLSQVNRLSKQGLALGKLIGANAEATADELSDWTMHFHMSTDQSAILARNVQMVGRLTGVTGDNLLNAVKSTKQLVKNMRDYGTLTDRASKQSLQLMATAQKYGREEETRPLLEAMQGGFFQAGGGIQALLANAAGSRGRLADLQSGQIMNTPGGMKDMAAGLEDVMMRLTGGRSVEDLQKAAAGGDREAQALLLRANQAINAMTEGQIKGVGALNDVVKTLKEGSMTTDDRIKEMQDKLDGKLGLISETERKQLQANLEQLHSNKKLEEAANLQNKLGELTQKVKGGAKIADLNKELGPGGVTKAVADYQKQLIETKKGIMGATLERKKEWSDAEFTKKQAEFEKNKTKNIEGLDAGINRLQEAMAKGPMDEQTFINVMDATREDTGDLTEIYDRLQNLDNITNVSTQIQKFNEDVKGFFDTVVQKLEAHSGWLQNIALYTAILQGISAVVSSIAGVLGVAGAAKAAFDLAKGGASGLWNMGKGAASWAGRGAMNAGRGLLGGGLGAGLVNVIGPALVAYTAYKGYEKVAEAYNERSGADEARGLGAVERTADFQASVAAGEGDRQKLYKEGSLEELLKRKKVIEDEKKALLERQKAINAENTKGPLGNTFDFYRGWQRIEGAFGGTDDYALNAKRVHEEGQAKWNAAVQQEKELEAAIAKAKEQKAKAMTASKNIDDTAAGKKAEKEAATELTGPLNESVKKLTDISGNTTAATEEIKKVKEEIEKLVALFSGGVAGGDTKSKTRAPSPANFWQWAIGITGNPNVGAMLGGVVR